ncbi:OmpH family outer membrane protein [Sulfidibacter corallicola]|uniref:OmpH family outer membrane protein n=1 Tax=Sulfidibacter corallicola TaxID=2818388 RepID=A0A8A4TLJ2_SULCO|nr:OmpH family outer membrane protein [Sulfidibacter corallicola]QTD50826.1 OmpH family outer membrane protein [Sulfidibacter corallicola]
MSRPFRFLLTMCMLAVSFFAPNALAQGPKIAVVDIDYAILQSDEGKALQSKLNAFKEQANSEGQKIAEEAREAQQQLQDQGASLSQDKKTELLKKLEDSRIALKRLETDKSREGKEMQDLGLASIEKKLAPVLEKLQKEGDYDMILNRVDGLVLVNHKRVDLTTKLIEELNKMK